jgi:hypothetical protein
MKFCDLDPARIVWGFTNSRSGTCVVRACRSQSDARIDAGLNGGELVYFNPDSGWVNAGTGELITQGSPA